MHINCLELLATDLAVRTFLKEHQEVSVLLQLDNSTAVAYINNLGGTVSPSLSSLAKMLWLWALERDILLTAQRIPGVPNAVVDLKSRLERDKSDWILAHIVFQKINQTFRPLEVDLFATRLTHQLPRFYSWRPDPLAEAVDAFQQNWSMVKGYANPPWCLVGRVLKQVQAQEAKVILVAPVWKGQAWYPVLLEMLMYYPCLIPPQESLLQREGHQRATEIIPQLAVWPVSGKSTEVAAFLLRLHNSCLPHGGRSPRSHMSPSLENGPAGVQSGVVIPFQVL